MWEAAYRATELQQHLGPEMPSRQRQVPVWVTAGRDGALGVTGTGCAETGSEQGAEWLSPQPHSTKPGRGKSPCVSVVVSPKRYCSDSQG